MLTMRIVAVSDITGITFSLKIVHEKSREKSLVNLVVGKKV